jgi:hypothetical protein
MRDTWTIGLCDEEGAAMTVDLKPVGERLPSTPEVVTRPQTVPTTDAMIEPRGVERNLARRMIIGIAISVPICACFFALLVGLALRGTSAPTLAPLLMGAGIGAYSACFWGFWFGIAASAHEIEEQDRRGRRRHET